MSFKLPKSLLKGLALGMLVVSASFAFSEGTDYVKLETPIANADKTLIKVFSYDCPFCYKYEKAVMPTILPKLPKDATYRTFHLKSKGKYGVVANELFAALIVKDQDNGITDSLDPKSQYKKAKMAYYAAYHDKRERWDAGVDAFLETGLKASGLTKMELNALKEDPRVKSLMDEWEQSYSVAKIQGVPGFVVNGKYLIYTKNITSPDGMVNLIKELLEK